MTRFNVLNQGYVRLLDHMGTDLTVVNAARVSFLKETMEMRDVDLRLMKFCLAPPGADPHSSIFRHNVISLEVYAPLMVARQWWKYVVASAHLTDQLGWNESSRRYVTEPAVFYVPSEWRHAPDNSKQGSGEAFGPEYTVVWNNELVEWYELALAKYEKKLEQGVAPELARLFLPAYAMYVRWRWTGSLWSYLHVINQRLKEDAQAEFTQYAEKLLDLLEYTFPEVGDQYRMVLGIADPLSREVGRENQEFSHG